MASLWFAQALLPTGWARDVRLTLKDCRIAGVETSVSASGDDQRFATAVPGLPNLHSHAFQRIMAGLAETPGGGENDDFWSWRALMYQMVEKLDPDDCAAIAAMAYVEMLESGFTRVGEFHYLHHAPNGQSYDNIAEMSAAIASAASDTGIGLTLLPVFYAHSGFGGLPPGAQQQRFVNDLGTFERLLEGARETISELPDALLGIAPHSLRAVTLEELRQLIGLDPSGPIHIHIAEQLGEVEACLAWSGARPVRWLLDNAPIDRRWCLVHATHVDRAECDAMLGPGLVVGLCPVTEANLGDGLFPAHYFLQRGGRIGLGSDSNVRIDASEEMRLLEYGQRLILQRRNVLAMPGKSTGRALYDAAFEGGSQALGANACGLAVGAPADIVALSRDPAGAADFALDRWVFARDSSRIDTVWRAGVPVVSGGRHIRRGTIEARFEVVLRRLAV